MKKIELKDIKVGDYFCVEQKTEQIRMFLVRKITNDKEKLMYEWWRLNKLKKRQLPEIASKRISAKHLNNYQFHPYKIYKLNKKERLEFKKSEIIFSLK